MAQRWLLLSAVVCILALSSIPRIANAELCQSDVCEYDFHVYTKMTMMAGQHLSFLDESGHLLYRADNGTFVPVPEEMAEGVLVIDGYERDVMTVNGIVPGPTIEVYEGAEVIVNVRNDLENSPVTFHWHGMWQHGTPWSDGVSMVTQCAILPATSFTYRFIAQPAGTHAWHAHHGLERPDGLFGALVVHKRPDVPSQRNSICDVDNQLMILSEWYHEHNVEIYLKRIGAGFYPNGPEEQPFEWTRMVDGRMAGEVPWKSGLFNGRGRYYRPDGSLSMANLTIYDMEPGKTHCFRVVSTMMEKNLRLSVDGHLMTVFASDGFDMVPFETESVIVHQGETFDIAITARPEYKGRNFYARIKTLEEYSSTETNIDHEGWAIMRYPGAPDADPGPDSQPYPCTAEEPCKVLNCPFAIYPPAMNLTCVAIDQMLNANTSDPAPHYGEDQFMEVFLNFEFSPLGVNRRRYVLPAAPLLTQMADANPVPCASDCEFQPNGCNCTHILDLPFNYTVQLVLTNMGATSYGMHPVHIHGHTYHVLKVGYPPVNATTGKMSLNDDNHDITCVPGTKCNKAGWTNGVPPVFDLERAVRKDTVVVPPGGYVVIRLVSDNPGVWHMHCHMAQHLFYGMGLVLNEAAEYHSLFPPPDGFPKCGNYVGGNETFIQQSVNKYDELMSGKLTSSRSEMDGLSSSQLRSGRRMRY